MMVVLDGPTPPKAEKVYVSVDDAPAFVALPVLFPPAMFSSDAPSDQVKILGAYIHPTTDDHEDRSKKLSARGMHAFAYNEFRPVEFVKLLSKIAHSYVMSHPRGPTDLDPLLPNIILARDRNIARYAGCLLPPQGPDPLVRSEADSGPHQLGIGTFPYEGEKYVYVQIKLFSYLSPVVPEYFVVVGKSRT